MLISLEPFTGEDSATYEFENKVTGGRIPRAFIPSYRAGTGKSYRPAAAADRAMPTSRSVVGETGPSTIDSERSLSARVCSPATESLAHPPADYYLSSSHANRSKD